MFASLVSMGLYHFHQRVYFKEVLVRIAVGFALGSIVLAAFAVQRAGGQLVQFLLQARL